MDLQVGSNFRHCAKPVLRLETLIAKRSVSIAPNAVAA
jgi:hypothetical protein